MKEEDERIFKRITQIVDAQDIVKETAAAISNIRVGEEVINAAEILSKSQHRIVTTGMGKAGHVALKMASTLSSLCMAACYVHPGEAAHGDLGMVKKGDILVAFSTSGKTREVLETVTRGKTLGAEKVIVVTSHHDAPIRELADIVIDMGPIRESGYLHIAPTTSIVMMLMYADIMATLAADIKGVTMDEFALRHHGGYLGEKSRGEVQ